MSRKSEKRMYFNCPIQVLYMMKEFGVKFEGYDVNDRKRTWWPFEEYEFDCFDISGLMRDFKRLAKYKTYVCKESEHIFEPKQGDKSGEHRFGSYVHENDPKNVWISSYGYNRDMPIEFRDNKHFFQPLIEN